MKHISKILLFIGLVAGFVSCNKVADLPLYHSGTAPVLTSSATVLAPLPSDSLSTVLTLTWTNPGHATDSTTYKYVIELDSTGRNFAKSNSVTVIGKRTRAFTAKELNNILLSYGYAFNIPVTMDVKVTSSYGNNNEKLASNSLVVKMTPYKIPPKVALPVSGKLFIVGDATAGVWNNPVPVPTQEFARLDETTWAGVFQLVGGNQYLLLPVNGDWTHKFAVASISAPGLSQGGNFGLDLSDNFPAPATSGLYKIVVDFQQGKFTVTPYTTVLPANLYIVGDATAFGWNNPVPVPLQQFTRINSSVWELTAAIIGGKQYLVLAVNGDWSKKYALKDNGVAGIAAGGEYGYHVDNQPAPDVFTQNFSGPATSGNYKISLNFAAPTTIAGAAGKFTVQ